MLLLNECAVGLKFLWWVYTDTHSGWLMDVGPGHPPYSLVQGLQWLCKYGPRNYKGWGLASVLFYVKKKWRWDSTIIKVTSNKNDERGIGQRKIRSKKLEFRQFNRGERPSTYIMEHKRQIFPMCTKAQIGSCWISTVHVGVGFERYHKMDFESP